MCVSGFASGQLLDLEFKEISTNWLVIFVRENSLAQTNNKLY